MTTFQGVMDMRKSICVLLGVFLLGSLDGIAGAQGTLRYIENEMPRSFDPVTSGGEAIGARLTTLIFSGLYTYDPQFNPAPDIAKGFPVVVGDNLVEVELHGDLYWHDGKPIRSVDVQRTVAIFSHENSNYPNIAQFQRIQRVEPVANSNRVRFGMNTSGMEPEQLAAQLRFALLPQHIIKGTGGLTLNNPFCQYPTGSGAFQYQSSSPNEIKLVKNRSYYKADSPMLEGVTMMVNQADNLHAPLGIGGVIDLDPVVRPVDVGLLQAAANVSVEPYSSPSWSGIAFRFTNEFLQFQSVRQALTYAFNRQDALDAHYNGQGQLISGPFPVNSAYYDYQILPYNHDIQRAQQLLNEAGFVDTDGDGVLNFNGRPFELNMVLSNATPTDDKTACADFAMQLKNIGVKVNVSYLENNLYKENVLRNHEFDMTFVTWKFDEASNIAPLFSKAHILPGRFNFIEYENDKIESFLYQFDTQTDQTQKKAIGNQLHKTLNEECPYLFLWTTNSNFMHSTRLVSRTGILNVHPIFFFSFVNDWYISP
jgi:peptide/nickel transport system substrate-binding protein